MTLSSNNSNYRQKLLLFNFVIFFLNSAGYFLLDPAYRGKQLQKFIWQTSFAMALDEGCPGFLGRMAVTATTPVAAYKAGYQFIGNIPRSLKIPEIGWVFDLVGIRDFVPLMTPQEKEQVWLCSV